MPRALVLLADGAPESDILALPDAIAHAGFQVTTCGVTAGADVKTAEGKAVKAAKGYLNVDIGAYDLVVVPGGAAGTALAAHKSMVNLVYSAGHKGRVVVAIGTGVAALLAAAAQTGPYAIASGVKVLEGDLVKGRKIAAVAAVREAVTKAGGIPVDGPLAVEGTIITAIDAAGANGPRILGHALPMARYAAHQVAPL